MAEVAIIDYGMGNLHSIAKALERANRRIRVTVSQQPEVILGADRVVFPGVGAIEHCMHEINQLGLTSVVREAAANKPFLGVCLGMQALLDYSEENSGTDCLGVFPGQVTHFPDSMCELDSAGESLKVPHMGWNEVIQETGHKLWKNIPQGSRFYFVHSYYCDPKDNATCTGRTSYGVDFASALARDNVFAVQFHPEKSQHAGLALLENFLQWDGSS